MKMNKLALACGVAMLGLSSVASAEISTNIGVTSNYVWRGVSQTGNDSAFSAGLDWDGGAGFTAGTWISQAADDYELDLYGGYSGTMGDFGYGATVTYYTYSPDNDWNFAELGLSGSFKMITFGLDYTFYSQVDDVDGQSDPFLEGDLHYYVGASFDLPQDYSIGLTIGQYTFDDDGSPDDLDYSYYEIDLSKSVGEFGDLTFSFTDTNIDEDSKIGGEVGDPRFFVSWAKSF